LISLHFSEINFFAKEIFKKFIWKLQTNEFTFAIQKINKMLRSNKHIETLKGFYPMDIATNSEAYNFMRKS